MARSDYGGPLFGLLCIAQPLLEMYSESELWSKGEFGPALRGHPHADRMMEFTYIEPPMRVIVA